MLLLTKRTKVSFVLMISFTLLTSFSIPRAQAAAFTQRIAGIDRYATAMKISQEGWANGTSQNVVLATGEDFPDALSAAPLAKQLQAPILLTETVTLSSELLKEINRLGAQNIYIVGGEGVVSKEIADQLETANFKVTRLAGIDRYETSLEVAQLISRQSQTFNEAVVATGENFPDALSIAPIAASKGMPILLSMKDSVSDSVLSYLKEHQVLKTYVVGGSGVVSDMVMNQLPGAQRLSGKDRYETNTAILRSFDSDINLDKVYAVTGEDYPDALTGSALAALSNSPLILATYNKAGINNEANNSRIGNIVALGGEGVLSPNVMKMLVAISNNEVPVIDNTSEGITYPKNEGLINSGNLTIKWGGSLRFTSYQVNVYEMGTALGWHIETKETSATVGPLEPDKTYQIEVSALPENGSQVWNFPTVTVTTESSNSNFLTSPVNGAVYPKGSPLKIVYTIPSGSSDQIDWHWDSEVQLWHTDGTKASFATKSAWDIPEYLLGTGKHSMLVTLRNGWTGEIVYSKKIEFIISN